MPPGLLESLSFANPLTALRTIVEILVISYLLYELMQSFRGTRAAPAVLGAVFIFVTYQLSGWLGLDSVRWLIGSAAPYAFIALVVIFQTEVRRALRNMALRIMPTKRTRRVPHYEYEDVVFAAGQLSHLKVGALIVIERETGLQTFIQSGIALDARLSTDLLSSIFQRQSPLHDGAVILQRGRVAAAACFLPLTTNPGLISTLGTRHRAAIGITEESDCLAIVVSEADGRVSVASSGSIELGISDDRLRMRMIQYFGEVVSPPAAKTAGSEPETISARDERFAAPPAESTETAAGQQV